jgi:hypothetical protein
MTKLTREQQREFLDLVRKTGSTKNGERVLARLRLNRFVITHGVDACQELYDAMMKRKRK